MANLEPEWWTNTIFASGESTSAHFQFLSYDDNSVVHEFTPGNVGCWDATMLSDSIMGMAWGEQGVKTYDLETQTQSDLFERPPGSWNQTRGIDTLELGRGEVIVAGGCNAGTLGVWNYDFDGATGALRHHLNPGGNMYDVKFVSKGVNGLCTITGSDTFRIYDLENWEATMTVNGCTNDRCIRMAYSLELDAMVLTKSSTAMCMVDLRTGEFAIENKDIHDTIEGTTVVDDHWKVVYGTCSGSVYMFDLRNIGDPVIHIRSAHGGSCMYCPPIALTDEEFATGASDSHVRTWKYEGGQSVRATRLPNGCNALLNVGLGAGNFASRAAVPLNDDSVELLMDSAKVPRGYEIRMPGKTLRTWKCLMMQGTKFVPENDFIELGHDIDVEEDIFCQLLLGVDVQLEDPTVLMEYFELFRQLGMKEQELLLCQKIEAIESHAELLKLAKASLARWEEGEEGEEQEEEGEGSDFRSVFTTAVFATLKKLEAGPNKMGLRLRRRYASVMVLLPVVQPKRVSSLACFKDLPRIREPAQQFSLVLEKLNEVMETTTDVHVVSKDNREFPGHLVVLLRCTKLFHQIMSAEDFDWGVFVDTRKITLDELGGEEVEALMQCTYQGQLETDDAQVVLDLLNFADRFGEEGLSALVMKKLPSIIIAAEKDGSLQDLLSGTLADLENKDIKKKIIAMVAAKTKLSIEMAYQLMQKSVETKQMEALMEEMNSAKEELESLRGEIATLGDRVAQLESRQ